MVKIWRKTDEFSLLLHLIVPSARTGHQIPLLMTCLGLPAGSGVFIFQSEHLIGHWVGESKKKKKGCCAFLKTLVPLECWEWKCWSCF